MAKKKKRTSKLLENGNNSIAGIPIEKCDLRRVKQSHAGVVYLTDNRSKYMTTKRQKQQEQIRIPTKTIRIDGTPTIYVYRGYLMIEDDLLIDYYMIVNDIQHRQKTKVIVAHNIKNKHYYMSVKQLENLHKKGFFPDAHIMSSNMGSEPLYTGMFRQYSQLKIYGYRVGNYGLPKNIRQEILAYIIDKQILQRYKIISLLNGNIKLREEREDRNYSKAIADWEEDIKFVNDYVL